MSFNKLCCLKGRLRSIQRKGIGFCITLGVLLGAGKSSEIFTGGLLLSNVLEILQEAACHGTHFLY